MSQSVSKAYLQISQNLEELQRIANLEYLRPYITRERCFRPNCDPSTTQITGDELKRLARAWKMDHEQSNFWKLHVDNNSLVAALMKHIEDTGKDSARSKKSGDYNQISSSNNSTVHIHGSNSRKIQNFFGNVNKKPVIRPTEAQELLLKSRFQSAQMMTSEKVSMANLVQQLRWEFISNEDEEPLSPKR